MAASIRAAEPADAVAIRGIYTPIVLYTSISFEAEVPSLEETEERVTRGLTGFPWLVSIQDGRVTGYAYAGAHRARAAYRWSAEVSIYMAEAGRRRGAGRTLYEALLTILGKQGYRNAYAGITLPNEPSVAFHEALGFTSLGVFHRVGYKQETWWDVGWWERQIGSSDDPTDEPVPFSEFRRGPELDRILHSA